MKLKCCVCGAELAYFTDRDEPGVYYVDTCDECERVKWDAEDETDTEW